MKGAGFTLIELMVTVTIIGILLGVGTLQFNRYVRKSQVESQVGTIYNDLMRVRTEALYQKQQRVVSLPAGGRSFSVYSTATSASTGVGTLFRQSYKRQIFSNVSLPSTFTFDTRGLLSGTNRSICIEPGNNDGNIDSVVIFTTRIQMGKSDGTCADANITIK